jgi:hypothetical protein
MGHYKACDLSSDGALKCSAFSLDEVVIYAAPHQCFTLNPELAAKIHLGCVQTLFGEPNGLARDEVTTPR